MVWDWSLAQNEGQLRAPGWASRGEFRADSRRTGGSSDGWEEKEGSEGRLGRRKGPEEGSREKERRWGGAGGSRGAKSDARVGHTSSGATKRSRDQFSAATPPWGATAWHKWKRKCMATTKMHRMQKITPRHPAFDCQPSHQVPPSGVFWGSATESADMTRGWSLGSPAHTAASIFDAGRNDGRGAGHRMA